MPSVAIIRREFCKRLNGVTDGARSFQVRNGRAFGQRGGRAVWLDDNHDFPRGISLSIER